MINVYKAVILIFLMLMTVSIKTPATMANENQLWQRIRDGFQLQPHEKKQLVQKYLKDYQIHEAQFQITLERAKPYLRHIIKQVEAKGLPSEIALLPFVESAFKVDAFSHKKAAGLWQIMPRTGRYLGLKVSKEYDGRLDVHASTKAAITYLDRLSKRFNGDWLIALAAYNAGQGRVSKAIKLNQQKGRKTDFWSLQLPKETRHYVPHFLAIVEIINNPDEYGIEL